MPSKSFIVYRTLLFLMLLTTQAMSQNKDALDGDDHRTTLIVTSSANPNDLASFQSYVSQVMPMLLSMGGKVIKRNQISDVYHGEDNFEFLLVMDFPSKKKLLDFFNSADYQALKSDRDKGFLSMNILFADDLE